MNTSHYSPSEVIGQIFLLGFMGSGKTHWGKLWAGDSGMKFYDLDDLIELREGKSIVDIFETRGEDCFRTIESEVLRGLAGEDNCIIACGGGTPCFHNNMLWMNSQGITVYLKADPSQIKERLLNEKYKRPAIRNLDEAGLELFIEQKLRERAPFYSQAKITLSITQLSVVSLNLIRSYSEK